jgi:hypothetical protein
MINKISVSVLFIILWMIPVTLYSQTEDNTKQEKECRKIRSGLSGTIGYSKLFLSDEVRPFYTGSKYYNLTKDIFLTVGTIIKFHPDFMSKGWFFRFDPEFAKYSYGSHRRWDYQDITSSMDIDVEAIKVPIALEYDFLSSNRYFHPFIRGGYSFAFFIDHVANFESVIYGNDSTTDLTSGVFNFSKFQNTLFMSGGLDLNLWNWDFTAELVFEKGDGIHKEKWGDSFLKISNTTNYFLRLGVLF